MTTPLPASTRARLNGVSPVDVLTCLPRMGRVMLIAKAKGVTFERIGPVERIVQDGPVVQVQGACHDATIDPSALERVEVDHSSVMRDTVYPRLEFLNAQGDAVLAVVGMAGAEPFDAALAHLARSPLADRVKDSPETRPDLAPDDPAHTPFARLSDLGAEVHMTFDLPGLTQGWRGTIAAVKPAMGFLNIMTPDFHLHLLGGTVGGWAAAPGEWRALGTDGQPTGLVLRAAALA